MRVMEHRFVRYSTSMLPISCEQLQNLCSLMPVLKYIVFRKASTFRTSTRTALEARGPRAPPVFRFLFFPPTCLVPTAGPHTSREIKNAPP